MAPHRKEDCHDETVAVAAAAARSTAALDEDKQQHPREGEEEDDDDDDNSPAEVTQSQTASTDPSIPSRSKRRCRKRDSRSDDDNKYKYYDEATPTKRRKLRVKQYSLHKEIDHCTSLEDIEKSREINNRLLKKVKHPRELVLDSENADMIATKFETRAEGLVQVPRYDPLRLVAKLRQKCAIRKDGGTEFDWVSLGRASGVCFHKVPGRGRFLSGLIEAQPSGPIKECGQRRRRVRQNMDDCEETQPEQVNTGELAPSTDNLSAAERSIKHMRHKLHERYAEAQKNGENHVDGIRFLFNPKSFTQTVENIFHCSFLIKKSETKIGVRSDADMDDNDNDKQPKGLYLIPLPPENKGGSGDDDGDELPKKRPARGVPTEDDDDDDESPQQRPASRIVNDGATKKPDPTPKPEPTQCVFSFTMRDFRRICKAHKLTEGDLGHRETSQRKGAPSQSDVHTTESETS